MLRGDGGCHALDSGVRPVRWSGPRAPTPWRAPVRVVSPGRSGGRMPRSSGMPEPAAASQLLLRHTRSTLGYCGGSRQPTSVCCRTPHGCDPAPSRVRRGLPSSEDRVACLLRGTHIAVSGVRMILPRCRIPTGEAGRSQLGRQRGRRGAVSALGQCPCFASDARSVPTRRSLWQASSTDQDPQGHRQARPSSPRPTRITRRVRHIWGATTAMRTPRSWQVPLTPCLASGRLANGDQAKMRPIGLAGADC